MKTLSISKYKLKNFLAQHVVSNILQAREDDLYNLVRHEGITGFEQVDDQKLLETLKSTIPEFKLCECSNSDNNNLFISVKDEYLSNEDEILTDLTRIAQIKMLS